MIYLLCLLVYTATALRLNGFQPTQLGDGFMVTRLPRTRSKDTTVQSSELKVTSNVLSLKKADAVRSLSSIYVQAMVGRSGISRAATNGTTPFLSVNGGQVFVTPIQVGPSTYHVVIDTGSSDPWLAVDNFQCYDVYTQTPTLESECYFGPTYHETRSTTFEAIPNQNFNISYADGEYLNGGMGFEAFTMAGITVPRQQFGVVDTAAWFGDGISSGLVGFAYRSLTSAYAGSDPSQDTSSQQPMFYNPLFANMYETQGVAPIFSLAFDRNESIGGVMALGGIPDIRHSGNFVTTPLQALRFNRTTGEEIYEFYTIDIEGFAVSREERTVFSAYLNGTSSDGKTKGLLGKGTDVIVDSGTSLSYIPDEVVEEVAAAFEPAGWYDESFDAYFVDCEAKAPVFGVGIGGKVLYVSASEMKVLVQEGMCVMGVQGMHDGLSILGATWLKNVLAVFDVGAEEMRFAARGSAPAVLLSGRIL